MMSCFKAESLYPFNGDYNKLPHFSALNEQYNGPILCNNSERKHFTFIGGDLPAAAWKIIVEDYPDQFEPLYITNGLGFRAEENYKKEDGPNAIMFAGDSYTYGIGCRQHEIFPHYIANDLNAVNWNIGAGGQGNEVIALMINHFLLAGYIPKKLVVTWSYRSRKLVFDNPTFGVGKPEELRAITHIPGLGAPSNTVNNSTVCKGWVASMSNQEYLMFWVYRNMVVELCKKYNIDFVEGFLDDQLFRFAKEILMPEKFIKMHLPLIWDPSIVNGKRLISRDSAHWGADVSRKVADLYLELLND